MDIFSARLKFTREKTKFSQKEVAEIVGMSPQGYGKLELGTREPKLEVLAMFPHIIGESTDFLLGVTDLDKTATRFYDDFIHLSTKIQMTINRIHELRESDIRFDKQSGTSGFLIESNDYMIRKYLEEVRSDELKKKQIKTRLVNYINTIPHTSVETLKKIEMEHDKIIEELKKELENFKR